LIDSAHDQERAVHPSYQQDGGHESMEMETAVRHNSAVIIVVANNDLTSAKCGL
jgi:hypothetical protein